VARRRNALGIALIVVDVAAWGVFAFFLVKTITTATSLTSCATSDCTSTAQTAADYVPWVVGSAFAASILLTGAILAFRMRGAPSGPSSWDQGARRRGGVPATGWATHATGWDPATGSVGSGWSPGMGAAAPGYGSTVAATEFALPQVGPTAGAPVATGPQASIVATRTVGSAPDGAMILDVDMDVATPNQAHRRLTKRLTVPLGAQARLYPGAKVPVRVDPANPADVVVDVGG
jgi:hypothetical protein